MKKFVLAAAAAATLAVGLGGAAQAQNRYGYNQGHGYGQELNQRIARIDDRIDRGVYRGDLNRREAYRLRRDLQTVVYLQRRYGHDGLTRWEYQDLNRRVDALATRVRFERRDDQDRGDRRWDDRRDDRRDDRGDRWDDRRDGRR